MKSRKLILLLTLALVGFGVGDLERGNRLYREGRFAEAVEAYARALEDGNDSPVLRYNLGTALLALGRFEEAEEHLSEALDGVDPSVRERVYYNLGNRYLREGRSAAEPERRRQLMGAAAESFRQALRLDPEDVEAKWNYELALEEQERQEPPPSDDSQDQQQQQNQDQQDQQSPGGGGGQGDQESEQQGGQRPERQPMTREQAERLLSAVEQDERDLVRETLRKGQRETAVARDW